MMVTKGINFALIQQMSHYITAIKFLFQQQFKAPNYKINKDKESSISITNDISR